MTDLSALSNQVLETIKGTEEYKNYKALLAEIKKNPAIYDRVNELREKNFMLQQSDSEDILDMMDALTNEYEDVINSELASEFLGAEVALCRLIQEFNRSLTDGLEFN